MKGDMKVVQESEYMSDDNLKRKRRMAYIENTISLEERKRDGGEECVCSIILQLMPLYLLS